MNAKTSSLIGMIIGAVCLLGLFVAVLVKFFTIPDFKITIDNALGLILLGLAPAIPFCPVYLSIIFDKVYEIKHGTKPTKENEEIINE